MKFLKEVLSECLNDLNPKSILDLGCGEGKISSMFFKKGARIFGVDKEKKESFSGNINFLQSDIRDFLFNEKYDLIIASMVLHFLKNEDALKLIQKIKKNTSDEGHNLLICMSKEERYAERNPFDFYVNETELEELYSGWEVIKNELCFSKPHQHEDGKMYKHKIIVFLAKKS